MLNQFSRSQLLIGETGMNKLFSSKIAIFGIGGVGGYVAEALARTGIGNFVLIDDDKVCLTNINRQIIATRKTVGKYKADVMHDRILEFKYAIGVLAAGCASALLTYFICASLQSAGGFYLSRRLDSH